MPQIKNDSFSSAMTTMPPPSCSSLTAAFPHESPWKKITYLLLGSWNTAAAFHRTHISSVNRLRTVQLKMDIFKTDVEGDHLFHLS